MFYKSNYRFLIIGIIMVLLVVNLSTKAIAGTTGHNSISGLFNLIYQQLESLRFALSNQFSNQTEAASLGSATNVEGVITRYQIDPLEGGAPIVTTIRLANNTEIPLRWSDNRFTENLRSGSRVRIKQTTRNTDGSLDIPNNSEIQIVSTMASSATTGEQSLAVLLIDFNDSGPRPFTEEEINDVVFSGQMQNFYQENSSGQIHWSGQIYPWQKLNRAGIINGTCRLPGFQNNTELNNIFSNSGIDLSQYNRVLFLANHPCMQGGLSTIGTSIFQINGQNYTFSLAYIGSLDIWNQTSNRGLQPFSWTNLDRLLSHELGHSLGLQHSNGLDCGDRIMDGNCQHVEYGNAFDIMGGILNGGYTLHFNGYQKELLGWIPQTNVLQITSSGRYSIGPLETSIFVERGPSVKLAKVALPPENGDNRWLYLEYRRDIGFDSNLANPTLSSNRDGLMANILSRNSGIWYTRLLDLSPTLADWLLDIKSATLNLQTTKKIKTIQEAASTLLSMTSNNKSIPESDQVNNRTITQIPSVSLGPIIVADNNAVTFDIGIDPDRCFRLPPNILSSSTSIPPQYPPNSIRVQFSVINEDYYDCSPSDLLVNVILPSGMSSDINSEIPLNQIAPRQSSVVSFIISTSSTLAPQTYPLTIEVRNLTTGLSTTRVIYVRIS